MTTIAAAPRIKNFFGRPKKFLTKALYSPRMKTEKRERVQSNRKMLVEGMDAPTHSHCKRPLMRCRVLGGGQWDRLLRRRSALDATW